MSSTNVEVVRSIYEAFNRRDWDAAFRDQDPGVELTTPPGVPNAGTFRGREQIQGFWEEMLSAFEVASTEPERIVESGDQVAVVVRSRLRPNGASAELEFRNGHLWTFRDGKVVSMGMFPEPEKAIEAVGLSR